MNGVRLFLDSTFVIPISDICEPLYAPLSIPSDLKLDVGTTFRAESYLSVVVIMPSLPGGFTGNLGLGIVSGSG